MRRETATLHETVAHLRLRVGLTDDDFRLVSSHDLPTSLIERLSKSGWTHAS